MTTGLGTGTTISFNTSTFSAEILEVGLDGHEVPDVDMTHMTSSAKAYLPGQIPEGGEVTMSIAHDPAIAPPVGNPPETIEVRTGGQGARGFTFTGYMKSYSLTAPLEDRMTAEAVIKVAGPISWQTTS